MKRLLLVSVIALGMFGVSAHANQNDPIATVRAQSGDVRSAHSGEFTPATIGERLVAGSRLMVAPQSQVTVRWDNRCERVYKDPGVYTIQDDCRVVAAAFDGRGAAIVAGVAVAGAAILANMERVEGELYVPPPPPVSP